MAAEFGEHAAQFRLEEHDESDGEKDGDALEEPGDNLQFQKLRNQCQAEQQDK